jgi:hypothetical protein
LRAGRKSSKLIGESSFPDRFGVVRQIFGSRPEPSCHLVPVFLCQDKIFDIKQLWVSYSVENSATHVATVWQMHKVLALPIDSTHGRSARCPALTQHKLTRPRCVTNSQTVRISHIIGLFASSSAAVNTLEPGRRLAGRNWVERHWAPTAAECWVRVGIWPSEDPLPPHDRKRSG